MPIKNFRFQKFIFFLIITIFTVYNKNILSNNVSKLQYNIVENMPDIFITPMTEKIGHTWSNGNVWDKDLIQKFYTLLVEHNDFFVMFDLGAQTGSFTLLSKYFPNSLWYAFEPIEEVADTLSKNLKLNDIDNVFVYPVAVTDFTGHIILNMPAMNAWGLATIGSDVLRFTTVTQRKIPCIDLDTFVDKNNIKKVHFMKLDTEGAELLILRGAQKMIMRDHPIIVMEYHEINMKQCGVLKKDIDDFLIQMGYAWHMIGAEDILCIPQNNV